MPIEIERRFLVSIPEAAIAGADASSVIYLRQGYLGRMNGLQVRVRIMSGGAGDATAFLTLKSRRRGFSREEYERPLALDVAERLLNSLPADYIIQKKRYRVCYGGSDWVVDFFDGPNAGLVIAEIELVHPKQLFDLPYWAGAEVTLDQRYGNSALARWPRGPLATPTTSECLDVLRSA